MVSPSRLMYLETPPPAQTRPHQPQKGLTAKMAAWALVLRVLTLCMLPDTISQKKCVFRSWHNFSSSLPVLLATSLSVSTVHLSVIFSNVGHWEDSAVWPIFQIPVSLQEQYLLLRMNFVGAGYVGLLPTGLSCWQPRMALFLGLSSHASGPLKHSGMNPRKTL